MLIKRFFVMAVPTKCPQKKKLFSILPVVRIHNFFLLSNTAFVVSYYIKKFENCSFKGVTSQAVQTKVGKGKK